MLKWLNILMLKSRMILLNKYNKIINGVRIDLIEFKYYNAKSEDILKDLHSENINVLYPAYILLFSKDTDLKNIVINSLREIIDSSDLFKLQEKFRKNSFYYFRYDYWCNISPINLILDNKLSDKDKVLILGLSSLHINGYYREKALRELVKYNTGDELKYIIIRVNDHVKMIHNVAERALLSRIKQNNIQCIYNNLQLILRLNKLKRYNHNMILVKIKELFMSSDNNFYLLKGIENPSSIVREYFYNLLLEKNSVNIEEIIEIFSNEKLPHIRYKFIKNTFNQLDENGITKYYKDAINDNYAPIKLFIINKLYEIKIKGFKEIIHPFLFDKSVSVREFVRFLYHKYEPIDFAEIYRREIKSNSNINASICGLGETGNINDVPLILEYINDEIVRNVKASLYAINKLDFENNKHLFLSKLQDNRLGIAKRAYKIIKNNINAYNHKEINNIFRSTQQDHVRKFSAVLLTSFDKWTSLIYILEFLINDDYTLVKLGKVSLETWISKYNKSFISPSNEQVNNIKYMIENNCKFIKEKYVEFITFAIKDY